MNRMLSLTTVLFKTTLFSFSSKKSGKKDKKEGKLIFKILLYLLFAAIYGSLVALATFALYDVLEPLGLESFILVADAFIFCILMVFFSVPQILSTFYFSKDIEYLLPLPFKPYEIIFSKLMVVVVLEYIIGVIAFFPVIFSYGYLSSAPIIFYLTSIMVFILIPIFPVILITFILMIFMRYTNIGKRKDLIRVIGGIFAAFIGVFINIIFRKIDYANLGKMDISMVENNPMYKVLKIVFYPAVMASKGLANPLENFNSLLIFVFCTVISIIVFYFASNLLYVQGAIGSSDSFSKREKLGKKELSRATKGKSVVGAYISKELKILFRTPAFFVNCVLNNIMIPVIMIIVIFMQGDTLSEISHMFKNASVGIFNDDRTVAVIIGVGFAVIYFLTSTNITASSAISREGSNIFITKYIPISYKIQVYSKLLASIIVQGVTSFIYIIIAIVILKLPIYISLAFLVFTSVSLFTTAGSSLIIDLINPKLVWDNENKAVKGNFISAIFSLVHIGISVGIGYLSIKLAKSPEVVIICGFVIMVIFAALVVFIINKKSESFFKKY